MQRSDDDKTGDFDVFGKKEPFSKLIFQYTPEKFDSLFELMRFNTLLHKDVSFKWLRVVKKEQENTPESLSRFSGV